ncbi:hypothetical protein [Kitasatospora sp. MBT63]|uniref:hypothetical protein n=1 Tax=Kitasatospora sp. MBT63 TaxID=1444768 RepID=UPI0005396000|nr:hypothetical protein [Kitasatospora sp. MBT63]
MALFKRLGWALLLLAAAFPAAANALLAAVAAVTVALLAHPSVVCAVAGGLLAASTLPALRRHTARRIRALRRLSGLPGS